MNKNVEIIEKIKNDCLEIHKENGNCFSIVVSKNKLNKVTNQLKECGVELHFNYGKDIIIEIII